MLTNLLIYRVAILNILCSVAVAWAWQKGFVTDMFLNDRSFMTYAASAVFVMGTASCFFRIGKVSVALNRLKLGVRREINGAKFTEKGAHLDDIGDIIVVIGLTGTAIGVVMMLRSFDPAALSDPSKLVEMATTLGDGLGTAFRSTIVSAIVWCWHICNLRMLKTATVMMIEDTK